MSDFAIVPYDEKAHRGYVAPTFLEYVREIWPLTLVPAGLLEGRLWPEVRRPGNRALVAVDPADHGTICGWVVTRPQKNEIVAGYTRYPLRRRFGGKLKPGEGVGTSLARAGGIDFERPVGVWFWTFATERMFREHAGFGRLFHKVTDDADPTSARRRPSNRKGPAERRP